ncbi:MAG TPA: phospholipid carrier-dependent glycosyltransferase [Actinomycetota bacterium]|nr:phospholipid carrier-dependent glycosyltransferase [Actinomycetota bacterium]
MPAIVRALKRPVVAILAVGILAGVLRFHDLGFPERRVFDEYYYPKSACILLGYSNERCDINSSDERFWREDKLDTGAWVHPPVGKWMIAVGELLFGTESFGWRVSAAAAGTLIVVMLAVMIQLLFGSVLWTLVGGLLIALENLSFVQSRVATLDVFVAFWIVAAFLLLLLDRRWIDRRQTAPTSPAPSTDGDVAPRRPRVRAPLWRPWRFAAGVAIGGAVATKWSGLAALFGLVLVSLVWEITRRRRAGIERPALDAIPAEGFGLVLAFLVVPAGVYVVSYTAWFAHFGWNLGTWAEMQGAIATYHENLRTLDPATGEPVHPYLSEAWQWLLLWRPTFYFGIYGDDVRRVIYANGNPAIFWASLLAIPYVTFAWWRSRDWRAGFIVVAIASQFLPWLLIPRPQFFFYVTPIAPFLVLANVYALRRLSEIRFSSMPPVGREPRWVHPYRPLAAGFVIVAVALFVWFWPTMTAGTLTTAEFAQRSWFPTWT